MIDYITSETVSFIRPRGVYVSCTLSGIDPEKAYLKVQSNSTNKEESVVNAMETLDAIIEACEAMRLTFLEDGA